MGREEYIEQAHFFRQLAERLRHNVPAQEVLASVREEVLATAKLPMAIDFLQAELRHEGVFGPAMTQLSHYFTPFQAFVVLEAENDRKPLRSVDRAGNPQPRSRVPIRILPPDRGYSSTSSRPCAAIGWATIEVSRR